MQTRQPDAHHGGYEPLGHGKCSLHGASQHPDPPRGVSNGRRPHSGVACAPKLHLFRLPQTRETTLEFEARPCQSLRYEPSCLESASCMHRSSRVRVLSSAHQCNLTIFVPKRTITWFVDAVMVLALASFRKQFGGVDRFGSWR